MGTSGGFTFVLEDRAGNDVQFLANNLATFLDAARKRPEIASLSTTFLPSVPQEYVDVDRDKVLKLGVPLKMFTVRSRRSWAASSSITSIGLDGSGRFTSRRRAKYRAKAENVGQFYVRNSKGENVPLSAVTTISARTGPEFTMRYNEYRSAQINGAAAPGYSSRPGDSGPGRCL